MKHKFLAINICFLFYFFKLLGEQSMILSLKQAEELVIQNNNELNASLHRLTEGYYAFRISKDFFYPKLSASAELNLTREQHAFDGAVRLTQPLYDKVAFYQIKESHIKWEKLRLDVQQNICDVLFQVRQAYFEIILNQAHLAVDHMVIEIWEEELKRQERRLALGDSIPYEINQTKLYLKNAWLDFFATEKNIKTNQMKLLTVLGLLPDVWLTVAENEIPLPPPNCQRSDREQWIKWAFEYRPELKKEQLALFLSQNKIKQTKAENKPKFNLYANAGHRYINNGFEKQPHLGVGINLDWTLYHPSYKHKIKQAQEESDGIASTYNQLELETASGVVQLLEEIEHFHRSYSIATEGAILAQEGMKLAKKKHELGLLSPLEFREFVKTLREAEQTVNQAKFNLRDAYEKLIHHTGKDLILSTEV